MKIMPVCAVVLFGLFVTAAVTTTEQPQQDTSDYCISYNVDDCEETVGCAPYKVKCDRGTAHCFVVFEYNSLTLAKTVKLKGCVSNDTASQDASSCRPYKNRLSLVICSCYGDLCNENFPLPPEFNTTSTSTDMNESLTEIHKEIPKEFYVYSICLIIASGFLIMLAITSITSYINWRRSNVATRQGSRLQPSTAPSPAKSIESGAEVELCSPYSTGRFGSIWRGRYLGEKVVVKMYMAQFKKFYENETKIFKLLHKEEHPSILRLWGNLEVENVVQVQYWIVTEYHEQGSLFKHLTQNCITWEQGLRIAHSIISGLDYLHENSSKPSIAHRDIKSSNIILKSDMTAAIADFSVALVLNEVNVRRDYHDRVGTLRYLAPEVLDGAITFNNTSFERIDVYAYALVLWEIVSRCRDVLEDDSPQYKLPFEVEVGTDPSLSAMLVTVAHNKIRPHIPQKWRQHMGISELLNTMEDCWDHDAEARLSSACVLNRLSELMEVDAQVGDAQLHSCIIKVPKDTGENIYETISDASETKSILEDVTVEIDPIASTSQLDADPNHEMVEIPTTSDMGACFDQSGGHDKIQVSQSLRSICHTDEYWSMDSFENFDERRMTWFNIQTLSRQRRLRAFIMDAAKSEQTQSCNDCSYSANGDGDDEELFTLSRAMTTEVIKENDCRDSEE